MSRFDSSDRASLRSAIHAASFVAGANSRRIGAEVELLALDGATHRPVPLLGERRGLISLLRAHGVREGWLEIAGYGNVPRIEIPGAGIMSFEPGGQIELSTRACASVAELVRLLDATVTSLRAFLATEGIEALSVGIDPFNDAPSIPLQLDVDRYRRMTTHFESIGPFGIRMMRQTAAIQISVDRGEDPASRWRLLNDLAPYLVAIFASSPIHAGVDTGHMSYRAHCWRQLDPSRTGMAEESDDPAGAYADFALGAADILDQGWEAHLTTLFPEVRPRGHFEVRSCDAIDSRWYAAPIVFITGLTYDSRAADEASLLAADSRALLRAAGERGLRDSAIARTARDLFQLSLDGARRLGPEYIGGEALEIAAEYFATYTSRDQSPADDALANRSRILTVRSRSSRV